MSLASLAAADRDAPRAGSLLVAGAMSGPVFYGLVVAQLMLRPGFDVMRHPLSLLSLGAGGWIQRSAFILAGLLVLAGLAGMRLRRSGGGAYTRVAALLSIFGLGTMFAGLFVPDPAFGFPPGTPDGAPSTMSVHSMLHGISFDLAFLAVILAMFVSGRAHFRSGDRKRAWLSIVAGFALPVLIAAGLLAPPSMGASFFAAGAIAFGWVSTVFLHARSKTGT